MKQMKQMEMLSKLNKNAKKSLKAFENIQKNKEALSMQKKTFEIPPIFKTKPLQIQLKALNGYEQYFILTQNSYKYQNKNVYHTKKYLTLMRNITPLKNKYLHSKDEQEREELAQQEINEWINYLEKRKKDLPEDYQIQDKDLLLLKENFDRLKDRKTHTIKSEHILDYHYNYSQKFKFRLPLHPKNMMQMIHPHCGYLSYIPNKEFIFRELEDIYRNQVVSSYERSEGYELFADELACLSYWLIFDKEKKGLLNLNQFNDLLISFRFDIQPFELQNIKNEFKFCLMERGNEFLDYHNDQNVKFRFDFARAIFLERGL